MFKSMVWEAYLVLIALVWTTVGVSWQLGTVLLVAWLVAMFILRRWPDARWSRSLISIGLVVAVSVYNLTALTRDTNADTSTDNTQTTSEEVVAPGTIVVEAGTGELINGGSYSYIQESARGLEAYLGDDQATAHYVVDVPTAGAYRLRVKLSDDGLHSDGARSATIMVNGTPYHYVHLSEDTKGWKYYDIATVQVQAGANTVDFIKDTDTTAAYVMDEFQLVPVQ